MSCLSLTWLENVLIWLIVVAAVLAIIRLVMPHIIGPMGTWGPVIASGLNIIIWALVGIAVITVLFDLLACTVGVPRLKG